MMNMMIYLNNNNIVKPKKKILTKKKKQYSKTKKFGHDGRKDKVMVRGN